MRCSAVDGAAGHVAPERLALARAAHAAHDAVVGVHPVRVQNRRHACADAFVLVGAGVQQPKALANQLVGRGAEHLAHALIAIDDVPLARKDQPHGRELKGQLVVGWGRDVDYEILRNGISSMVKGCPVAPIF